MISRLEHIGIAHFDTKEARHLYKLLFDIGVYKTEKVEREGVATHFLDVGNTKIELLEALNEDSPITKYLRNKGQGIHHLAFETPDIQLAYQQCVEKGFKPLHLPKEGADGKVIFFLHPKETQGILIEFCQQNIATLEKPAIQCFGTVPRALKEVAFPVPFSSNKIAYFGTAVSAFHPQNHPQGSAIIL